MALSLLYGKGMSNQPTNLTMHRAEHTVWDRQDSEHSRGRAMGALGFALIAVGTALVAYSYRSQLACLKGQVRPVLPWPAKTDEINKASEQSFPASDAPSFTPAVGKAADVR
jgi:hypothetical protein